MKISIPIRMVECYGIVNGRMVLLISDESLNSTLTSTAIKNEGMVKDGSIKTGSAYERTVLNRHRGFLAARPAYEQGKNDDLLQCGGSGRVIDCQI
jgi:hypothetical protein